MEKEDEKLILAKLKNLDEDIVKLGKAMNLRFEKMKQFVSAYLVLGSEFSLGALRTSLKEV